MWQINWIDHSWIIFFPQNTKLYGIGLITYYQNLPFIGVTIQRPFSTNTSKRRAASVSLFSDNARNAIWNNKWKKKLLKNHNKLFTRALRTNLHGFFICCGRNYSSYQNGIDHTLKNIIYLYFFFIWTWDVIQNLFYLYIQIQEYLHNVQKKKHEPTVTKSPC